MRADGAAGPPWPWWLWLIALAEVALLVGTTVAFGFLTGLATFLAAVVLPVLILLPIGLVQGYRRSIRRNE